MPLNQFTILATVPQNANLSKEYDSAFRIVKHPPVNGPTDQRAGGSESNGLPRSSFWQIWPIWPIRPV